MDQITKARPKRKISADYESELNDILAEFDRVQERIDASQASAETVRAETAEIKRHTRIVLESMCTKL